MEKKDNLNYHIESGNILFGGRISKFSLILMISLEILGMIALFLPLLIFSNFLVSLITFSIWSILNIFSSINWSHSFPSIYQTLYNLILYYADLQKIKANNIIKNKIIYQHENIFAFVHENKLIIKSFFQILSTRDPEIFFEKSYSDLLKLLQDTNLRFYSIKSTFNVEENINKFQKLIIDHVDFSLENILDLNTNKLLLQQFTEFNILDQTMDDHNINVVEFSREYIINARSKTILDANMLSAFKVDELAFRTNLENLQLNTLNDAYMQAVRNQILFFNDVEINCKVDSVQVENANKKIKYYRYLKVSQLSPLLDLFFLYELFNNPWKYEVSITYTSLSPVDEARVIDAIEAANSGKKSLKIQRGKKSAKSTAVQLELNREILENQIIEIERAKIISKGMSVVVRVEANNKKELEKAVKEFCAYFKRQRIRFSDLTFLQKNALMDFHLGLEDKLNKKGKEKKYRFSQRRFNNINAYTLWLTAENCAYSLPIKEGIDIEPSGYIYGIDAYGNPIAIDFELDRPNCHTAIIGQSGSGKTTAAEYLLNQKLIQSDHRKPIVLIIDPKNEYQDIVQKYGGITLDLAQGFANPFVRHSKKIEETDVEFLELFLLNFLAPLNLDLYTAVGRLHDLILLSHEWKENNFSFDTFFDLLANSNELRNKFGHHDYEIILDYVHRYSSKGTKSHLFNNEINLDFNKKIISFNFSKLTNAAALSNDAKTLIFVVLTFCNNLMKTNNPKHIQEHKYRITLMVDEFHLLVNAENNIIIKQFNALCAISRSYGVNILLIFQTLQIMNNPLVESFVKGIFDQISYLIAFNQTEDQFNILKSLLPDQIVITDLEKEEITSGKKHQSLVIYDNNKKLMQWNIGLFYDQNRDRNTDGLKDIRIKKYQFLKEICDSYIKAMKEKNL